MSHNDKFSIASFVSVSVRELQSQMFKKRIEMIQNGNELPDSGSNTCWFEEFRDKMPEKNIVIPSHYSQNGKQGIDLLFFDNDETASSIGKFIISKNEITEMFPKLSQTDFIEGSGLFFGYHYFKSAIKTAEMLILSDENLTGKPNEWIAPFQNITLKHIRTMKIGFMIFEGLLCTFQFDEPVKFIQKRFEGLESYWKECLRKIVNEICLNF
jgi:hypothetical protein